MSIVHISPETPDDVIQFLKNPMPPSFRYFNKRGIDILHNHLCTVVYKDNNIPVGYAHIDYDTSTLRHFIGVCILDMYQKKGIGSILINHICDHALQLGIERLYLTVDNNNTHAIYLYKKFGFQLLEHMDTISLYMRSMSI